MLNLKNYIQCNKHFFFPLVGILLIFGVYNSISYCIPGLAFVLNTLTGLSTEFWTGKAIDGLYRFGPAILSATITHFPTINFLTGVAVWTSIGGVSALYTLEIFSNRYYILNKYAESITLVRWTLNGVRFIWPSTRFDADYKHFVKPAFEYILPKGWIFPQEIEKPVIVEKEIIHYKDRPQLKYLHNKLDQIERSVFFINDNSDFHNKILREMNDLSVISNQYIHEDCAFLERSGTTPEFISNLLQIEVRYANFNHKPQSMVGEVLQAFRYPTTFMQNSFDHVRRRTLDIKFFGKYDGCDPVALNQDYFKAKYPKMYLLLKNKMSTVIGNQIYDEKSITLNVAYKNVGRGILSTPKIDPESFTLEYIENGSTVTIPINDEIEMFYDSSMNAEKAFLQELTDEVRGFIYSNTNSEIDDYLVKRLQTETLINKSKDLISIEEYIHRKRDMASTFREIIQPVDSGTEEEKGSELEDTTGITETQTDLLTPLSIGSVGLVASLTQLPLDQVFLILNHILGLGEFEPLINNAETVYMLTQLYENNGLQVPEILQNYVQTREAIISEPNSFVDMTWGTFEAIRPYIIPTISTIGLGMLVLGSSYLIWKYTGDSSIVVHQKEIIKGSVTSVLDQMID